ncbi:MAG TPA: hypothetical protein VLU54_08515 [Casimicrobiaceae bacterium]|nr:hypothetical protein [Casimicrobiaceae bacterium]
MLNEARFSLLLDPRKDAAELMAECALCGAITTRLVKLAWQAPGGVCKEWPA